MRLDMRSRKAIVGNTYKEYQQADKKGRSEILDRLVPVTGMNRDYLATLLGTSGKGAGSGERKAGGKREARPEGKRGGRPPVYGKDFVKVLTAIWYDHGRQSRRNRPDSAPFPCPSCSSSLAVFLRTAPRRPVLRLPI